MKNVVFTRLRNTCFPNSVVIHSATNLSDRVKARVFGVRVEKAFRAVTCTIELYQSKWGGGPVKRSLKLSPVSKADSKGVTWLPSR